MASTPWPPIGIAGLTQQEYLRVMKAAKQRLAAAGVEDLSLRGNHLLLSLDRSYHLATDREGEPLVRVCNFELLKKVKT